MIIGAKPGTNVVSPCDGVITHVAMNYYLSLNKSFSIPNQKGKFEDIIEQNKESMANKMQDAKYLSYMYLIKSNDGRTIYIRGLRTDTPFATGQKVKKGEVLGQVHYCYKKIPQPSICFMTIDRGGKPDDPMAPFGLKTTFIPPVNQKPKAILTRAEAIADYRQMASSVKEIYPSLEDFMTEEEYDTFVEEEIAKISENITLKEFAYLIMNFNRKVHDSHMWFDYGIPLDNDGTISPVMFARVDDKVRIIVTTDEYKAYTGREITHVNGKHVDTLCMEIAPRTSMIYDAQVESVLEQELASLFTNHLYYKGDKDAFKAKKATLTFSDGEELTVPLMEFNQNTISQFDRKTMENWFISQYMVYRKGNWETMKSNDSTAYMRLNNFELMETEVDSMLVFLDLLEKKGYKNLIIDLRGNPGGNPDVVYKLVDALMDEPIKREGGYMKVNMQTIKSPTLNYPSGTIMFEDYKEIPGRKGFYKISEPNENAPSDTIKALYTGRVYVLINANSASASTEFAGIMKRNARGYVIGRETKTAYHTMNALKFAEIGLPNSHFKCHIPMVRIVSDEFVSEDFPYGRGVIPHLTIPFTYEEMTSNGEMIYNKALELIRDGIYLEEPEGVIETADKHNRYLSYIVVGIFLVSLTLYFGLRERD